jgi:hypothetical protein
MNLEFQSFRERVTWLAALIEGEGTFVALRGSPRIVLAMTDRDVIEQANRAFAATGQVTISRRNGARAHWRTIYRFALSGAAAAGWMMILYQFLGERRQIKIRDILHAWAKGPAQNRYRIVCPLGHPLVFNRTQRYCAICARARYQTAASSYRESPHQLRLAP